MKNFILSLAFIAFLCSCGPAAENREAMYARAKVFQDSIANSIKTSMDAAAAPAPVLGATQPAAPQPTAQ